MALPEDLDALCTQQLLRAAESSHLEELDNFDLVLSQTSDAELSALLKAPPSVQVIMTRKAFSMVRGVATRVRGCISYMASDSHAICNISCKGGVLILLTARVENSVCKNPACLRPGPERTECCCKSGESEYEPTTQHFKIMNFTCYMPGTTIKYSLYKQILYEISNFCKT